ncbi:MAG TPA: amidohydrolase family protein [Bryobacteraceae bacterium]|nr:amidohydrolase family protein [Bryobacteraceae bacterium]
MPIIDFHNHYYPPGYLKVLQSGRSAVEVTIDDHGNPLLHYPGDYNIAVPGQRELKIREKMLNDLGIDMQVLTMTTPGTHVETPANAVKLASLVNDEFAAGIAAHPGRFSALATLPLNDPAASVKELERACRQLGLCGAMLFSNVNHVPLADSRFLPLYEMANDLEAVLYIHPTHPLGVEAMTDYWLMPLVGFLFDTTLAASKLVFAGIPERFPKITWVLTHLGGAIPYLAERLDRGHRAFKECRVNIQRPPSEYLKKFYYDTVNFNTDALNLAIAFAGADHLLAGSDYAHQIGSPRLMLESLRALNISESDRAAILGGNAARLLRIGSGNATRD